MATNKDAIVPVVGVVARMMASSIASANAQSAPCKSVVQSSPTGRQIRHHVASNRNRESDNELLTLSRYLFTVVLFVASIKDATQLHASSDCAHGLARLSTTRCRQGSQVSSSSENARVAAAGDYARGYRSIAC
ncbi:hypothetical protein HaLaN_33053, partial [Haematococcus lacustris]